MKYSKVVLAILLSTIWISISEFVRNDLILKSYWTTHYNSLGLIFPNSTLNGLVWGIWSLVFAIAIYIISRKFSLTKTTLIAWLMGFLLMWLSLGNLKVLPFGMLYFAVPLSLLETFIAAWISIQFDSTKDN